MGPPVRLTTSRAETQQAKLRVGVAKDRRGQGRTEKDTHTHTHSHTSRWHCAERCLCAHSRGWRMSFLSLLSGGLWTLRPSHTAAGLSQQSSQTLSTQSLPTSMTCTALQTRTTHTAPSLCPSSLTRSHRPLSTTKAQRLSVCGNARIHVCMCVCVHACVFEPFKQRVPFFPA